jgi:hypothetical protein
MKWAKALYLAQKNGRKRVEKTRLVFSALCI